MLIGILSFSGLAHSATSFSCNFSGELLKFTDNGSWVERSNEYHQAYYQLKGRNGTTSTYEQGPNGYFGTTIVVQFDANSGLPIGASFDNGKFLPVAAGSCSGKF